MLKRILTWRRRRAPTGRPEPDLQRCRECGAASVHPVEWESFGDAHWWMGLRCGACWNWAEVLVDDDAAQRFDRALDLAQYQMGLAADRLRLEGMSAQADRLAVALDRDLIGADDFAS
jgi:hypothetical protein